MYLDRWTRTKIKNIIQKSEMTNFSGPLTDRDIKNAFYTGEIYISPFSEKSLTPVGYNFGASELIISTKTGLPLKVIQDGKKKYVNVAPHDTVLVTTRESLFVGEQIMGTFHSRVRNVSQGFGHISTTLDPMWKGALLIALNNPSGKKKKLILYDNNEPVSFVTLVFYRFKEPAVVRSFRPPNRTDILAEYLQKPKGIKKLLAGQNRSQYIKIVDTLNGGNKYHSVEIFKENNTLNKLNSLYDSILSECKTNGYIKDLSILSSLESIIGNEEAIKDLPTPCIEMTEITAASIEYFNTKLRTHKNKILGENLLDLFVEHIKVCKKQIRYEQQSVDWKITYNKCVKLSQENNFSSFWMRLTLGTQWKAVLIKLLGIILPIAAFLIITMNFDVFKENFEAENAIELWVVLLGVISSFFVNILSSLFKSSN